MANWPSISDYNPSSSTSSTTPTSSTSSTTPSIPSATTEKFEAIEPRLRAMYDAEMLQLRGIIDATAKEKAVVELKVETLEGLYKEFRLK